jgi:hypothetical protein
MTSMVTATELDAQLPCGTGPTPAPCCALKACPLANGVCCSGGSHCCPEGVSEPPRVCQRRALTRTVCAREREHRQRVHSRPQRNAVRPPCSFFQRGAAQPSDPPGCGSAAAAVHLPAAAAVHEQPLRPRAALLVPPAESRCVPPRRRCTPGAPADRARVPPVVHVHEPALCLPHERAPDSVRVRPGAPVRYVPVPCCAPVQVQPEPHLADGRRGAARVMLPRKA